MNAAYRLCAGKYPANSGLGAALRGGRWNPVGVQLIYSASTASLAALEVLVQFAVLPVDFALSEIAIPDSVLIEHLPASELPIGWDSPLGCERARYLGARWVSESTSAALSVPSRVIRTERNILINPAHTEFETLLFLPAKPFQFDSRLK